MIVDQEGSKGDHKENAGLGEHYAPNSESEVGPPPYPPPRDPGPSTSSAVVVASHSGYIQPTTAPPSDIPTNGVNVTTILESIRGSWLLDPLAPQSSGSSILQTTVASRSGRRARRSRNNMTMGNATAKLTSRNGGISAAFRVVGFSGTPATAIINATTRGGNIVLELVSKDPIRTVHFDAYSQMGNVTLLIPRNFSGLVELRARNGNIELLPALASFGRIVGMTHRETVVLVGNGAPPGAGFTGTGDFARLCSHSGRLRLGFSGEDTFTESEGIVAMATQMFQKLTVKSARP